MEKMDIIQVIYVGAAASHHYADAQNDLATLVADARLRSSADRPILIRTAGMGVMVSGDTIARGI